MTPYLLSKKFIKAKILQKEEITKRVNTFYTFGQIGQAEYEELMQLIEVKYAEEELIE